MASDDLIAFGLLGTPEVMEIANFQNFWKPFRFP